MRLFKGLLFDRGEDTLSKGMTLLWVVFGIQCAYWIKIYLGESVDIPSSLTTILQTLLVYNFGKKLVPIKKEEKNDSNVA